MGTRFHGWPDDAHQVLLELDGEPSRPTRERVRRRREAQVRQPMIDLLNDLADLDSWYVDFSVWGYGTTAYWWQNQCGVARVARHVYIGFRFNLDGLQVGASWRYAGSEQIALFRAAAAAQHSGRRLQELVSSLAADGHEIGGDVMKRVPRGYPADHPRADLLRHRSLGASWEIESEDVRDVQPVYEACERLRPLLGWFAEHTSAEHTSAEHTSAEHTSAEHTSAEHTSAEHTSAEHASAEHASAEHASVVTGDQGRW